MKALICYFSASGTTKQVAVEMSKVLNADLFEIEPKEKYTKENLNWLDKKSRSSIEMNEGVKPEILRKVSNLNEYDTICLGFPIWWYKEPTIINKFLDENDMSNKKIFVFVTSGSSTIDSTYRSLKSDFPNLNFVKGKRFTTHAKEEEYLEFINE